ncbi:hypothetical protein SRHO_G00109160 [Serrasalmus rhombeus]
MPAEYRSSCLLKLQQDGVRNPDQVTTRTVELWTLNETMDVGLHLQFRKILLPSACIKQGVLYACSTRTFIAAELCLTVKCLLMLSTMHTDTDSQTVFLPRLS